MSLSAKALLHRLPLAPLTQGEARVRAIATDSRAVAADTLFMARRGWFVDANRFVPAALEAGAQSLVLTDAGAAVDGVPSWLSTAEDRDLGLLADRFYGAPTEELAVFAVTGTNGKTSVTFLLEHLLASIGERPAVIGTVAHRFEGDVHDAKNTTPDGLVIHGLARRWRTAGATCLLLEASSHGLHLERVAGVAVDVVGFTNLTVDHLDYHETFDAYRDAKRLLFTRLLGHALARGKRPAAVAFADGAEGRAMLAARPEHTPGLAVGLQDGALRCEILEQGAAWTRIAVHSEAGVSNVRVPIVGRHNVANIAVALGMVRSFLAQRARLDAFASALASLEHFAGIPGRFELAATPGVGVPPVFVDYAHSPDAVAHAVSVLRDLGPAPRTVVLGCGGDRDTTKRPQMAAAAAAGAERCVFTSDNPRSESPAAILDDMMRGLDPGDAEVWCIEDRSDAIAAALETEGPVLVAGKGHETYQEIGGVRVHLDDGEEVRRALAARREGRGHAEQPLLAGWSAPRLASALGGALAQRGPQRGWGALTTDSRAVTPEGIFVALRGDRFDGHAFVEAAIEAGAGLVVVERAVEAPSTVSVVRVEDTRQALIDLASALLREARRRAGSLVVVGITGSNGKTTTKEYLHAISRGWSGATLVTPGNWNNHIGLPLTVARIAPHHRVALLEMGANQPEDIAELAAIASPDVGVITSIGKAHTEGFGSLDGVRHAKSGMVRGAAPHTLVLPLSERAHDVWSRGDHAVVTVGADDSGADVEWSREGVDGPVSLVSDAGAIGVTIEQAGAHNGANVATAWASAQAVASLRGEPIDVEASLRALAVHTVPGGRMRATRVGDLAIIDDAYNANPSSMRAALSVLTAADAPRKVAVLGDMFELGESSESEHAHLGRDAAAAADRIIAVGPLSRALSDAACKAGADAVWVSSNAEVAPLLAEEPSGTLVLLKASRGIALESVVEDLRRLRGA